MIVLRFLVLICLLCSCGESSKPQRVVDATLAPALRVEVVDEVTSRCSLGRELRPSWGCLEALRLPLERGARPEANIHSYSVRPRLRGQEVVAVRDVRKSGEYWMRRLPSLLVNLAGPRLKIPIPTEGNRTGEVMFYALRPAETIRISRPIVPSGESWLEGGFGLDLAGLEQSGPAIDFRIVAEVAGREPQELVRRRVEPGTDGGRWHDYRVDLSGFTGESVVLRFATGVADASASAAGLSFPLWSVPALLEPPPDPELPNLLLVSLDTLRADHVGAFGADFGTTPNLDRFASQAAVFENVMTTLPNTTASHMSLFTGTYPNVHQVTSTIRQLDGGIPVLAEMLAAEGFLTRAVTENGMLHAIGGFSRGFDAYDELRGSASEGTPGRMKQVIDRGLVWLERHRRDRSFLFLHTYQVHSPYEPPPEFDHFQEATANVAMPKEQAAYAAEVAYADSEMQRLLDGIEKLGLLERTIVIVTSDHGEGFGEHSVGHNATLYQPELHIPLMIRAPGRLPAGRYASPVSLVDLLPTVLDLLELPAVPDVQGRTLLELVTNPEAFADRPIFAELAGGVAVRVDHRKWIASKAGEVRSYDLQRDPTEDSPEEDDAQGRALIERYALEAEALRAKLDAPEAATIEIDAATEAELRVLGYIE